MPGRRASRSMPISPFVICRLFSLVSLLLAAAGAATGNIGTDEACLGCHTLLRPATSAKNLHPAMGGGCDACHVTHGENPKPKPGEFYLAAKVTELCSACHAGKAAKEFVHAPVAQDCTFCHDPHASGGLMLKTAEPNKLCLGCHLAGASGSAKTIALSEGRGHPVSNHPVSRKEDKEWPAISCLTCHDPHSTDKSSQLLVTETETFESLCLRCHK